MKIKTLLRIVLALALLAVFFIGAIKADYLWWWVNVGGIRGDKIRVRSEIDGVVQESVVTIPATFRVSAQKQAIDFWITKTVTNEDLWVIVSGRARRRRCWAWWNDQQGVHVSVKKGHLSVWKINYQNPNPEETNASAP